VLVSALKALKATATPLLSLLVRSPHLGVWRGLSYLLANSKDSGTSRELEDDYSEPAGTVLSLLKSVCILFIVMANLWLCSCYRGRYR
jgi:hypothetical protein